MIEIGNMAAIKHLVSKGLGITFMFEVAVQQEIEEGILSKINIADFSEQREFNFVFLKNSFFRERYMHIFNLLKQALI